jgi:DNA-binding response OmpR family regulator
VLKKIMVVDDSQAELALMRSFLEQAGYWVVELGDASRLEPLLEIERPSLLLLDVVMPQRNGFQVCRELKSSPQFAALPVLLVSSKSASSDRFWGMQQGADGYLVKPFTQEQLTAEVRRLIG